MPAPDPYVAFLSSLQDAHAAAATGANAFTPGVQGIPGAPGASPGSTPGSIVGGGGVGIGGGASVPGTATTGSSVLEDILSGARPSASPSEVVAFLGGLGRGTEPGERGDFEGTGGGDLGTLAAVMGGPMAMGTVLGSLVLSDMLGLPPTTSMGLSDLLGGGDPAAVGLTPAITSGVVSDINNIDASLDAVFANNPTLFGGGGGGSESQSSSGGNSSQFDTPEFGV